MPAELAIRAAQPADADAAWEIFRAVIHDGGTFAFEADTSREVFARAWLEPPGRAYVAIHEGRVVGSYYLRPVQPGRGAHVANAGYMSHPALRGRGIGAALGRHSMEEARRLGYRAMQFNLVVSTNAAAVHLWQQLGFRIIGTLPGAFRHAALGYVDAHIMFRSLV